MGSKHVGTWILGDTMRELHYTVKSFVTDFGTVSGWTVKLQGKRKNDAGLSIDLTAASFIVDPADAGSAIAKFDAITAGISLENEREDEWECRLKLTKAADTGYTDPFAISIRAWP